MEVVILSLRAYYQDIGNSFGKSHLLADVSSSPPFIFNEICRKKCVSRKNIAEMSLSYHWDGESTRISTEAFK